MPRGSTFYWTFFGAQRMKQVSASRILEVVMVVRIAESQSRFLFFSHGLCQAPLQLAYTHIGSHGKLAVREAKRH